MDIYILGLYFLTMSLILKELKLLFFLLIALVMFAGILTYRWEKKFLYIIFTTVFLLRVGTGVNFREYSGGERVDVVVTSSGRSNLVKSIDGRVPRKRAYISGIEAVEGEYRVQGKILQKEEMRGNISYKVRAYEQKEVEKSIARRYLDDRIDGLLEDYTRGLKEFYRGVIAGDKGGLDRELKDRFSYTGTSHLIVISGLHIGVIIALIMYLADKLPVSHDLRYVGVMAVLSLYVLAVGATPSIVRAYIMGVCYLGSSLFYEEADGKKSFFTAMTINLLVDPLGAGTISFQLSYMAVFSILFIYPEVEKYFKDIKSIPLRWLVSMASLSLVIQVALTPIFAMNFRSIPVFSFLVNIVAIPLGVLFVQAAFTALLLSNIGIAFLIMPTVNLIYHILVGFIYMAADLPFLSVEYRGVSSVLCLLLTYLGMALFISRKGRVLSLVPLFLILLINRERSRNHVGDRYIYYSDYPRVVAAEKKLNTWDLEDMWNSRIKGIEVVVASGSQDEWVIERMRAGELIVLGEGGGLRIGSRKFKNIDGKIVVTE